LRRRQRKGGRMAIEKVCVAVDADHSPETS
jgi:hypothetical protein